eukprot:13827109-Ditylum_brightwellii.AAC.1
MHKWRGTSRTNKITESNADESDEDIVMEEEVPGSKIMHCLLDEDIQMLPGTVDAYMREVRASLGSERGSITHHSTSLITPPLANKMVTYRVGKCAIPP